MSLCRNKAMTDGRSLRKPKIEMLRLVLGEEGVEELGGSTESEREANLQKTTDPSWRIKDGP